MTHRHTAYIVRLYLYAKPVPKWGSRDGWGVVDWGGTEATLRRAGTVIHIKKTILIVYNYIHIMSFNDYVI